jgi:hypothetical protein
LGDESPRGLDQGELSAEITGVSRTSEEQQHDHHGRIHLRHRFALFSLLFRICAKKSAVFGFRLHVLAPFCMTHHILENKPDEAKWTGSDGKDRLPTPPLLIVITMASS